MIAQAHHQTSAGVELTRLRQPRNVSQHRGPTAAHVVDDQGAPRLRVPDRRCRVTCCQHPLQHPGRQRVGRRRRMSRRAPTMSCSAPAGPGNAPAAGPEERCAPGTFGRPP